MPNTNIAYTGAWSSNSNITFSLPSTGNTGNTDNTGNGDDDANDASTSPNAIATIGGADGGLKSITWTVKPVDAPACDNNSSTINITNMYPGSPSIAAVDEVKCVAADETMTLSADFTPADINVHGTWSSTTTASVITDENKNNKELTFTPNMGVNKFIWTIERTSNTYANCRISETVEFDNKYVKGEVPTTVFESCDNTVKLTAVKVWDYYSGAEGWWSTNDASAYFIDANNAHVKEAPHGSSTAENLNEVTAYGIPGKGATFYWNVKNGDPDNNKGCLPNPVEVTVNNNGLPAEVETKSILLCDGETSTFLRAKTIATISGAHGEWVCVEAPDRVNIATDVKIESPNSYETKVSGLDVNGGIYKFEWKVWKEVVVDGVVTSDRACETTAPDYAVVTNGGKNVYAYGSQSGALHICEDNFTLDATAIPDNYTGTWSVEPPTSAAKIEDSDLNNPKAKISGIGRGEYATVIWTLAPAKDTDDKPLTTGCEFTGSLSIYNDKPTAKAQLTEPLCTLDGKAILTADYDLNDDKLSGVWSKRSAEAMGSFEGAVDGSKAAYTGLNTAGATAELVWTIFNQWGDGDDDKCSDEKVVTVTNDFFEASAGNNNLTLCTDTYDLEARQLLTDKESGNIIDDYTGYWEANDKNIKFEANTEGVDDGSNDPRATVSQLDNGKDNVLTWHYTYKQCPEKVSVITLRNNSIAEPEILNTSNIDCDGVAHLYAANPENNTTGYWSTDNSNVKIPSDQSDNLQASFDVNTSGSITFYWTLNNICVKDKSASISLTNDKVEAKIVGDENVFICPGNNNPVILKASAPNYEGATGWWTSDKNNIVAYQGQQQGDEGDEITYTNTVQNVNILVNPDDKQNEDKFVWHVKKGKCEAKPKTVTLMIPNMPIFTGETSFNTCEDHIELTGLGDVSNVDNGQGEWIVQVIPDYGEGFQINGETIESTEDVVEDRSGKLSITNLIEKGSYTIVRRIWYMHDGKEQCTNSKSYQITRYDVEALADPDGPKATRSVCGSSYQLSANEPGQGLSGKWTNGGKEIPVYDPENPGQDVAISDPTAYNATVYNIPAANGVMLTWTVSQSGTSCSQTDAVTLKNESINAQLTGPTATICDGTATLSTPNYGDIKGDKIIGYWSKASDKQSGNFVGYDAAVSSILVTSANVDALKSIQYENIGQGSSVKVKWTLQKTLASGEICSDTKEVELTNFGFSIADDEEIYTGCDDFVTLYGNLPDGSYDTWTGKWTADANGSAKFDLGTSSTTEVENTNSVKVVDLNNTLEGNTIKWTVTSTKCGSKEQTITLYNSKPTAQIKNKDKFNDEFVNCNAEFSIEARKIDYPANGESGLWTAEGTTTFSDKGSKESTVVTNMPNGDVQLTWTVTRKYGNNQSCSTSDFVTFNNLVYTAQINTDPKDLAKCLTDVTINATPAPDGVTGVWTSNPASVLEGNAAVNSSSLYIKNIPAGSTTFTWTLTADNEKCGPQTTSITIDNHKYNGNAGEDQYLCEDTYNMNASDLPTTAKGTWSLVEKADADATISMPGVNNPHMTVSGLGKGANKFMWAVKNYFSDADKTADNENFCYSESFVTLNNMSFVADANANTDSKEINICTDKGQLNGATYGSDHTIEWTVNSDKVKFADAEGNYTATTANVSAPKFDLGGVESAVFTMKVTRTLTNGKTCEKSDDVTVYNRKPKAVTLATPVNTCNGEVDLNGQLNNSITETGFWTKESSMGTWTSTDPKASITNTEVDVPAVTLTGLPEATSTTVNWTIKSLLVDDCATTTDVVVNNYGFKPSISGYVAESCSESTDIVGTMPSVNNNLAAGYTGKWTASAGVAFGDANNSGSTVASTTVLGLKRGENQITWTVNHKDYACSSEQNAVTVTIKNLKAGNAELNSEPEQWVCVGENGTITLSAKTPETGVQGTWTSSVVIPEDNKHDHDITINPGLGVSTYTWTVARPGVTDNSCNDSKTITIHNNYVKAEVEAAEFISCNNNVVLKAIDITKTVYGSKAIGYWTSTSASFDADKDVKQGADNAYEITAYNVTSNSTFTWNVKKTDVDVTAENANLEDIAKNKTCYNSQPVTVQNYTVPAVVTSKSLLYCDTDPEVTLTAESIADYGVDAKGLWTCVDAPTGVDKESVNALIVDRGSYTTVVKNLPKNDTYKFSWKTWMQKDDKTYCETTATDVATVLNDSRRAYPIKTNPTAELVYTCDNDFAGLNATEVPNENFVGTWEIVDGDKNAIASSDINNPTAKLKIADGSRVKVRWTIAPKDNTISGCPASGAVTIENNAETATLTATTVCDADGSTNLTASYSASTTDIAKTAEWWVVDGTPGRFDGDTDSDKATYTGIPRNGSALINFTLTTKVGGVECNRTTPITVNNNYYEADAGSDGNSQCKDTYTLNAVAAPEGATGKWTGGTGITFTSTNDTYKNTPENDPKATVNGLSNAAPNVLTWTVSGLVCGDKSATVRVVNNRVDKPTIEPATSGITCNNTVDLRASKSVARDNVKGYWSEANVTWKTSDGKEGYANVSTANNVTVVLPANSSNTFVWNVVVTDQNDCNQSSDPVVLTNKYYEAKILSPAVKDYSTCGNTVTLQAQNSEENYGVKGHWEWDNDAVTFANTDTKTYQATDYVIAVTGLTSAATKFRWIVDDDPKEGEQNCDAKEDYVSVSNISVTATASVKVNCDHSATLHATAPTSGTGQWVFVSGSILKSEDMISGSTFDHSATDVTITGLKGGNYKYKWVVTTNDPNCYDEVELSFDDNALDVYADTRAMVKEYSTNVCGNQFDLSATAPVLTDATGKWTNAKDGSDINDLTFSNGTDTDYSVTITGVPASGKTIRWTVTNPDGCEYHDDITLTNVKPVADFSISGNGCDGKYTLTATNEVSGDEAIYTGVWSKGESNSGHFEGQLSDVASVGSNLKSVTYEGISAGQTIKMTWTITRKDDASCSASVTKDLTNNGFTVSAGKNRNTNCEGEDFIVLEGTAPDGYNGVWTCSDKNVKFSSNTNDTEGSTTQGGTRMVKAFGLNNSTAGNVFTWTVTNDNCATNPSATVTIYNSNPNPKLNTKNRDNCDPTITLSAYPLEAGVETGVWSGPQMTYTPADKASEEVVVSNLNYGKLDFSWTVTRTVNGKECTKSVPVSINNKAYTAKIVTKPSDINKCVRNVTLTAIESPDPEKIVGTWTSDNSTVTAAIAAMGEAAHSNVITVTDIPQGAITFYWTLDDGDGGCSFSQDYITFTNEQVSAYAGDDAIFCGSNGELQAKEPTSGTGVWTPDGTSATINNPGNYYTTVTDLKDGANKFTWTVTNVYGKDDEGNDLKCVDAQSVVLYNHGFTTTAEKRNNDNEWNVCGTSDKFSASLPIDGSGVWTWDGGEDVATVENPASNISAFSLKDNVSNVKFTWTETRSYTHTGERGTVSKDCKDDDYVTVYNRKPVVADIDNYPTCDGSVQLHGLYGSNETGVWSKTVSSGNFGTAEANVSTTDVADVYLNNIPPANSITLTWTVSSTVLDKCSTPKTTVAINYGFKAQATTTNDKVCAETATLSGNIPPMDGYKGYWGAAPAADDLKDASANNTYAAKLNPGKNSFTWSVFHPDFASCISSASVDVTNMDPSDITVPANQDVCLAVGENFTLTATKSNDIDVHGTWTTTTNGTVAADDASNESLTFPIKQDANTFVWTVEREGNTFEECKKSQTVTITNNYVKPEVVSEEFVSCDGTVTLIAKNVVDTYGDGAVGYWSKVSTTSESSFSSTEATNRGADNVYEATVYNATNGETFMWNVSKNGKCGLTKQVTVKTYEVAAEITNAPKYVCEDDQEITLKAKSIEAMSDYARGVWTCIDVPTGVNKADITAAISNADKSEATVKGLNVKGAYTFQWQAWMEIDGKEVCKTQPATTVVTNDKRAVEAVIGNKTGIVRICDETFDLNATAAETGFVGTWSIVQGDEGIIAAENLNNPKANVTVGLNNTVKVKWSVAPNVKPANDEDVDPDATYADSDRCPAESTITIANDVVTPTIALDAPVCDEAGTANLTASYNTVGSMTGTWGKVAGDEAPGDFTASDNTTATFVGIPQANTVDLKFTLRNTVDGHSCDKDATITVTNDYYTFSAGNNATTACSDEIDLTADVLGPKAKGSWTQVEGLTFTSTDEKYSTTPLNDPKAHVKGLSNITATTLTWTVANGKCPATAKTVTITNNSVDDPVITNKESGVLCYNTLTLNANAASPARTNVKGYWTLEGGIGVDKWEANGNNNYDDISTLNNISVTLTPNTEARFKWHVDVLGQEQCNKVSEEFVISNKAYEAVINKTEAQNEYFCEKEYTLEATPVDNETYNVHGTWTWTGGTDDIKLVDGYKATDAKIKVEGFKGGDNVVFTWTVDDGDAEGSCPAKTATRTLINVAPVATIEPLTEAICGHTVTLYGNTPVGATGMWKMTGGDVKESELTFGPEPVLSNNGSRLVISNLKTGNYQFQWIVTSTSNTQCSTPATINFTDNSFEVWADNTSANATKAHNTTKNVCGPEIGLSATQVEAGEGNQGTWTIINDKGESVEVAESIIAAADVHSSTPTVKNIPAGAGITLQWNAIQNGCPASDQITLRNIKPNPIITADRSYICDGTIELYGSPEVVADNDEALYTGAWSVNDKATGNFRDFANNSNKGTIVYEKLDNQKSATITWTVTMKDNPSCFNSATKTIFNENFAVNAGDDRNTTCVDYVTLTGTTEKGTGVWTGPNGVTFSSEEGATEGTDLTGSTAIVKAFGLSNDRGGNTFTWTVHIDDENYHCGDKSDEVTIYYNKPVAQLYDIPTTNCYDKFEIKAYPLGQGETGKWTGPSLTYSPATMDSPTEVVSGFKSNETLTFTWTVTRTNNGQPCESDPVSVSVKNDAFVAEILTKEWQLKHCMEYVDLQAADPTVFGIANGTWSCTVDDFKMPEVVTNTSIRIEDLPFGPSTFVWTLSNTCGTKSAQITVHNDQVNAHAGEDKNICVDYYTLGGNNPAPGTGKWTMDRDRQDYAPKTGVTEIAGQGTDYNNEVTNLGAGANVFIWTVTNKYGDGDDDKCEHSDEVVIYNRSFTVDADKDADNVTKTRDICEVNDNGNGVGKLNAELTVGYKGYWTFDETEAEMSAEDKGDAVRSSSRATRLHSLGMLPTATAVLLPTRLLSSTASRKWMFSKTCTSATRTTL